MEDNRRRYSTSGDLVGRMGHHSSMVSCRLVPWDLLLQFAVHDRWAGNCQMMLNIGWIGNYRILDVGWELLPPDCCSVEPYCNHVED